MCICRNIAYHADEYFNLQSQNEARYTDQIHNSSQQVHETIYHLYRQSDKRLTVL